MYKRKLYLPIDANAFSPLWLLKKKNEWPVSCLMRHEFDLNHHFTITNYYYFSTTRRITDHQIQSTTTTNWSNYLPERLYSLKLKIWCFDLTLQRRVKTEIVEFENWMDAASLDRGWTSIFNRWSSSIQKLEVWFEKKSI